MLITSFAEMLSIGAIVPFLAVITDPSSIFTQPALRPIIDRLGINRPDQLLLPFTILFGVLSVAAGIMRLSSLWLGTRLSFAIGADFSVDIYRRTLYQSYALHCNRNSSEIINGIVNKTSATINIITMLLMLASAFIMLVAILIALFSIDFKVALAVFSGFGLIYYFIIRLTRNRLQINGEIIARESGYSIKYLQEGLGGIRDVLMDGTQEMYCRVYKDSDCALRKAQASSLFISGSPRYVMESLGMLVMACLAYFLSTRSSGLLGAIPLIGALALGAQRLLPVLQQAYTSWVVIQSGKISLKDTLDLLDQPVLDFILDSGVKQIHFDKKIELKSLGFRYDDKGPDILDDINLEIYKGARIGFVGHTGSGKSTLLDILMGLLEPSFGLLTVDGRAITKENHASWRLNIAHVPQVIFLSDASISENIAFGVARDEIDMSRVIWAANQAQIAESIEGLPEKYQTKVGERGVRLSGGQRQRIGIARALYKKANVIIFDEATSALDSDTEEAIMNVIDNLSADLTLLIIAHRISTLKNCNQIVELEGGSIKFTGTYLNYLNKLDARL